jgi:hypothetical protein
VTLFYVTLERRRNGSACGTTKDLIEANTPAEAEAQAIKEWTALLKGYTFAPLLTVDAEYMHRNDPPPRPAAATVVHTHNARRYAL